jgi:hypothetical protein
VKGRPYLLALAMCAKAFCHNLINQYDRMAQRLTFRASPPPVIHLLLQALEIYDDCGKRLAKMEGVTW